MSTLYRLYILINDSLSSIINISSKESMTKSMQIVLSIFSSFRFIFGRMKTPKQLTFTFTVDDVPGLLCMCSFLSFPLVFAKAFFIVVCQCSRGQEDSSVNHITTITKVPGNTIFRPNIERKRFKRFFGLETRACVSTAKHKSKQFPVVSKRKRLARVMSCTTFPSCLT